MRLKIYFLHYCYHTSNEGLVSLPEIYLKFRRLMDDRNSTIGDFSEVVGSDPNLAGTVLKVVNSAYFGFPGQIDSISRAIALLGFGTLHHMVLGASAMTSLDFPNDIVPLRTFWQCSLFTGVLARLLAIQLKIRNDEGLFVIGLLHEIGHLIIYSKYPRQAKEAIERRKEGKQMIHIAEQAILGFHYGQMGANLMAQWQLPTNFQVMTYFQPTLSEAPDQQLGIVLLHVAHGYAQHYFADTGQTLEQLISPEAWDTINLVPGQIQATLEKALQASSEMEKAILR
jgi:HD-like signal output (HDOD) protein